MSLPQPSPPFRYACLSYTSSQLLFHVCCSDIMMRDNLFEVVTTSRTFYIQVGIVHASVWSSVQTAVGSTTEVSLTLLSLTVISLCTRLTVQRRCTAGSKLSQEPSWPSEVQGDLLQQYVSLSLLRDSTYFCFFKPPTLILVIYDCSDVLSWCRSCWELKRELNFVKCNRWH